MHHLQPGQLIERYVVERVLGAGGHASVYQVRHEDLGVVRALKVLHAADPTMQSRLITEGRVLAQLSHPNLVAVYDVLRVNGAPALVMEFVGGGSLDDWLQGAPAPVDEVERVFRAVCAGVQAAHAAGVIHRDLKPGNVLLDDTHVPARPKVADFGIARVDDDLKGHQTRTAQGLGSPAYMAPEQGRDAASVDVRADVWSLGALLYALLAGRPPFEGGAWWEILAAAAAGQYVSIGKRRPGVPESMVAVTDACLRPSPNDRPPDVVAVLKILDGQPWVARPTLAVGAAATMDWDSDPAEARAVPAPVDPASAHARDPEGDAVPVPAAEQAAGVAPRPRVAPRTDDDAVALVSPVARERAHQAGVATALVVDVTGRGHAVDLVVTLGPGDGGVWTPTEVARDAQVAAQAAAAAALGPRLATVQVTWQVRGVGFRLEGTSLGLAMAVACVSASTGRAVPAGWCFTGGVDIDGRLVPVAGVPAKLAAAAGAGLSDAAVPPSEVAVSAPVGLRVHQAARLGQVVDALFRGSPVERGRRALAPLAVVVAGPLLAILDAGSLLDGAIHYPAMRAAGRGVQVDDVVVVELPVVDDTRSLRATYPELLGRLADAGAVAVLLDLTLVADSEHDAALAAAVAAVTDRGMPVVAPARVDGEGVARPAHDGLAAALRLGHAVSLRDLSVGWVRRAPARIHDEQGAPLWHVSALAAAALVRARELDVDGSSLVVGPLRVALDRGAFMLAPAGDVLHLSADGDLSAARGKLALVGVVRDGTDLHATPDGTRYGVDVLAVEVQTLLRQAAPRRAPLEVDAVIALVVGALSWTAGARRWVPWALVGVLGLVVVGMAAGGILLGLLIPVASVAACGLLSRRRRAGR